MAKSNEYGMQTFDQALFQLYEGGYITYEDALRNADSINDLRLKIKLQGKDAKNLDLMQEVSGIKMQEDEDETNKHRIVRREQKSSNKFPATDSWNAGAHLFFQTEERTIRIIRRKLKAHAQTDV